MMSYPKEARLIERLFQEHLAADERYVSLCGAMVVTRTLLDLEAADSEGADDAKAIREALGHLLRDLWHDTARESEDDESERGKDMRRLASQLARMMDVLEEPEGRH
ncbi:MAG: hypothetical protein AB1768_18495 [Pseudomonadota bacterium]